MSQREVRVSPMRRYRSRGGLRFGVMVISRNDKEVLVYMNDDPQDVADAMRLGEEPYRYDPAYFDAHYQPV